MIDKQLEKYYEDRFSMMSQQGWQDLIEDVELIIEANNKIGGISTLEELHFKKGELNILNWIKSLKEVSEKAYEELHESDE